MEVAMDDDSAPAEQSSTGRASLPVVRVKFEHPFLNERRAVLMKRPLTLDGLRQTAAATFGQQMPLYYWTSSGRMLLIRTQFDLDHAQMDLNRSVPLPYIRLQVSNEPSPGVVPADDSQGFMSPGSHHSISPLNNGIDPLATNSPRLSSSAPRTIFTAGPAVQQDTGLGGGSRPSRDQLPSASNSYECVTSANWPKQAVSPQSPSPSMSRRDSSVSNSPSVASLLSPRGGASNESKQGQPSTSAGMQRDLIPGSTSNSSSSTNSSNNNGAPARHSPALVTPNNWRIGRKLGVGGFGAVYLCHDMDTGQQFALKQVVFEETGTEMQKEVKALEAEIEVLKSIQHDRIVAYIGVHRTNTTLSILMEYMPGGSIHIHVRENGALTEVLTRKYTYQILEGLAYLHSRRIIHRDVKGANILRDSGGNVKLADFGASRQLRTIRSLMTNKSIQGTPYWMSPEVIRGKGYDEKADIWSLGCTMVEMLTTKPPWFDLEPMPALFTIARSGANGPDLPTNISPLCHHFLKQLFIFNYEQRPTAQNMLEHDYFLSQ